MDGSVPKSLDRTYEAVRETFVSAGRIEPASGTRKRSPTSGKENPSVKRVDTWARLPRMKTGSWARRRATPFDAFVVSFVMYFHRL